MTTSSSAVPGPRDDHTAESLRSRASSIVTTTTKFSLETLSQDDRSSIGALRDWQRPTPASRPRSLRSMTSIARPAPPYTAMLDSDLLLLPTHQNGDFQPPAGPQAEPTTRPAAVSAAASTAEVLPPSPSAGSTASPRDGAESPTDDPDNPRARIITYYNLVVRTLDQNYTASLEKLRAQHASDLASTRHSIDAAYRAQWKAKNREIEVIRQEAAREIEEVKKESAKELESLEKGCEANARQMERAILEHREQKDNEMAVAVLKARHEVEDLWERRWAERMKVEGEEKKRREREHLVQIEKVTGGARKTLGKEERVGGEGRDRGVQTDGN
ncbi:MAG: hypothetical protein LQ346_002160 [Caloplaca aetnensis]|nr:MAG: hypothetical protein LQ346_002160 [Caloplaca aetnensis]